MIPPYRILQREKGEKMLIHWIWLAHRPGVNDRAKLALLRHFSDPEEIFFADSAAFDAVEELTEEGREALADKNLIPAEEILECCQRENLNLLTFQDAAYPKRLKNIPDPPILLYYKGRLPELDGCPVIGVVGTRKASAYGMTTAKRMGYQIARCGGIVVSGMAYGIDGMAMSGALTAGKPVVGVLGCGADIVYPLSNKALFRDTERFGCILSEFPPGTPPVKWNFPKRNRLISGLSCGVLVIEAPEISGSLITAHQAAEQGRDVFVVPGNIDIPSFGGSNRLMRDGAIPVSSGRDVVGEYQAVYPDKISRDDAPAHQTAYPDEVLRGREEPEKSVSKVAEKTLLPGKNKKRKKPEDKKSIDKPSSAPYSDVNNIPVSLSPEEQAIVKALEGGERLVDDVIAETGLTTGKLLAALTMLELKGILKRLPGKRIVRK